jgi:hypothetical protein
MAYQLLTVLSFQPNEDVSKPIEGAISTSIGEYDLKNYKDHLVQLRADYYAVGSCIFYVISSSSKLTLVFIGSCRSNSVKTFKNKKACDKYVESYSTPNTVHDFWSPNNNSFQVDECTTVELGPVVEEERAAKRPKIEPSEDIVDLPSDIVPTLNSVFQQDIDLTAWIDSCN